MLNREAERNASAPAPSRFGAPTGPDPAEAGRRGGLASGVARRQRPLRLLEAKILESKNGAAQAKLLELKRRDEAKLEPPGSTRTGSSAI